MSPTSSRNRVPWWASSKSPALRTRPSGSSSPNSSASMRDGSIAAALIATKRPAERGLGVGARAQLGHLPSKTARFDRPLHGVDQTVGLERLLDEVVGAAADGGDR